MRHAVLLCLSGSLLFAQTPPAKPAFEAVSIKPTSQTFMALMQSGKTPLRIDDAQVELRAASLSFLIQYAFGVPPDRISGPGWLEGANFEILAKLPAAANKNEAPEMLQTMLAERFKLAVHHREEVQPVYLLTVGKGTLKLKQSAGGDPEQQGCQGGRGGHHACQNVTMEGFAALLTRMGSATGNGELGRPAVDRTGLQGAFDFAMDYGRVGAAGGRRGDAPPADSVTVEVSIAEAVKALGLALAPGNQPFDILVIDHVERVPTAN